MYHVITNLELLFDGLDDARDRAWEHVHNEFPVQPRIPYSADPEKEDTVTPRICGAPTIEQCITAIGVTGMFRRCCNSNPDAKSYENDQEAYPVLILKFSDDLDWHKPDTSQVPDVESTNEHWLEEPAVPESAEIRWMDAYSIDFDYDEHDRIICKAVRFLGDVSNMHHPWLDGKGHPLDCSDMGCEPWPDKKTAMDIVYSGIYYDKNHGGNIGFITPSMMNPNNGSCHFQPLDTGIRHYKTFLHSLKKFSGFFDKDKTPIFEGFTADVENPSDGSVIRGTVYRSSDTTYRILPWNNQVTCIELYSDNKILPRIKIIDFPAHIKFPERLMPDD